MTRQLVVNSDDFGCNARVNEAIERCHREGILTCTNLMVAEPATDDAVARARHNPDLRVGLHLVVVANRPMLPPGQIDQLVDGDGKLSSALFTTGMRYTFNRKARVQLRKEIAAQFAAFLDTGLPLDHVNTHKHLHAHPFVNKLMVEGAIEHGAKGLRTLIEPDRPVRLADGTRWPRSFRAWARYIRRRAAASGLVCNDHLFGQAWTGDLTEQRLLALLPHLPEGISEVYAHPGAGDPDVETVAFTSSAVRRAIKAHEIQLTTYTGIAAARGATT